MSVPADAGAEAASVADELEVVEPESVELLLEVSEGAKGSANPAGVAAASVDGVADGSAAAPVSVGAAGLVELPLDALGDESDVPLDAGAAKGSATPAALASLGEVTSKELSAPVLGELEVAGSATGASAAGDSTPDAVGAASPTGVVAGSMGAVSVELVAAAASPAGAVAAGSVVASVAATWLWSGVGAELVLSVAELLELAEAALSVGAELVEAVASAGAEAVESV